MSIVIISYDAKCKHCLNLTQKKNKQNKSQSYCKIKEDFTTLKTKACESFKL